MPWALVVKEAALSIPTQRFNLFWRERENRYFFPLFFFFLWKASGSSRGWVVEAGVGGMERAGGSRRGETRRPRGRKAAAGNFVSVERPNLSFYLLKTLPECSFLEMLFPPTAAPGASAFLWEACPACLLSLPSKFNPQGAQARKGLCHPQHPAAWCGALHAELLLWGEQCFSRDTGLNPKAGGILGCWGGALPEQPQLRPAVLHVAQLLDKENVCVPFLMWQKREKSHHRDKAVPWPSTAQGEDEEAAAHLSVCILSSEQGQEQGPTDFLLPLHYRCLLQGMLSAVNYTKSYLISTNGTEGPGAA